MSMSIPRTALRRDPDDSSTYTRISPKFTLTTHRNEELKMMWDGAFLSSDGEIVLIEEERCRPVEIHIQGHVARLGLMIHQGINVRKCIWVCEKVEFEQLKRIVESIRNALFGAWGVITPPCDYLDTDGKVMGHSGVVR